MDIPLISNAITLSESTHDGIFRKYFVPEVPYATHPRQVADRVARLSLPHPTLSVAIAASYLHDTLEDQRADGTYLSPEELEEHTNSYVRELVEELTNPSKNSTEPRAVRKQMDRDHLAQVSDVAKLIKLIDRTVNLEDLTLAPSNFRKLYVGESILLFEAIGRVSHPDYPDLANEYVRAVSKVRSTL